MGKYTSSKFFINLYLSEQPSEEATVSIKQWITRFVTDADPDIEYRIEEHKGSLIIFLVSRLTDELASWLASKGFDKLLTILKPEDKNLVIEEEIELTGSEGSIFKASSTSNSLADTVSSPSTERLCAGMVEVLKEINKRYDKPEAKITFSIATYRKEDQIGRVARVEKDSYSNDLSFSLVQTDSQDILEKFLLDKKIKSKDIGN